MKELWYHGSPIVNCANILKCGKITEGCITPIKSKAKIYCGNKGLLFNVTIDIPIIEIIHRKLFMLIMSTKNEYIIDILNNNVRCPDLEIRLTEPLNVNNNVLYIHQNINDFIY